MYTNPKLSQLKKFLKKRDADIGFKEVKFLFELVGEKAEVIESARKIYRAWYLKRYKKQHRNTHPECVTFFSEFEKTIIENAAEKHRMSKPEFVKKAAIAYINQQYLLPNEEKINAIEQYLAGLASEFSFHAELYPGAIGSYLQTLQKRFTELEEKFSKIIREPKKSAPSILTPESVRQGVLLS